MKLIRDARNADTTDSSIPHGTSDGEGKPDPTLSTVGRLREVTRNIEAKTDRRMAVTQQIANLEQVRARLEEPELGVSRLMVPAFFFAGPDGLDRLSEFGESIIQSQ